VKSIKVTAMTKKVASFLQEKIGVTPLVSVPGDTNHVMPLSQVTDLV